MFHALFRRLAGARLGRQKQPQRCTLRPRLEELEERTLLTTRSDVAVGLVGDGISTFNSLAAALHASGYQSGDIIEIGPGSVPGNVVNADLTAPGVTKLIIEGDPAVPLSTIPQFTIGDSTTFGASESGITFKHVNIGLVSSGALNFNCQATVTASSVTDYNSSAANAIVISGPSTILANSTFVNDANLTPYVDAFVVVHPPAAPNTNSITGNVFEGIGPTPVLLQYDSLSGNCLCNDQVANNTFIVNSGQSFAASMFMLTGANGSSITGLSITDNTFTDTSLSTVAIDLTFQSIDTRVLRNSINLTGAESQGIYLYGGTSGTTTTSATIENNQISTGATINNTGLGQLFGSGLLIGAGSGPSNAVDVKVQGNDFHNNQYGVTITTDTATSPLANIDLGGGSQGSIGGNDFRSFTSAATEDGAAIIVTGTAQAVTNPGIIFAERNIFGVTNPQTVVDNEPNVTVNTSNNLTGNAAFVETLYQDLFKRTGDTTAAADAGSWVNGLNAGTMTPASAVHGISYSAEAFDFQVNALYLRLLGRTADSGGLTADVNYLVGGGSMEQIITNIATSPEFNGITATNANFVESLFVELLGRTAGPSEVSGWLAQLATIGETGVVNGMLTSTEFRYDVAAQLYGAAPAPPASVVSLLPLALHRPSLPTAAQITSWADQGLSILTIENDFMSGSEFFMNG